MKKIVFGGFVVLGMPLSYVFAMIVLREAGSRLNGR